MHARPAPRWFPIVAVLLILWGVAGVIACVQQIRFGAEAMGPPSEYDRRYFAALPAWYNLVYAVAVLGGLAGSVALLLRSRLAVPCYIVSLVAVVVQFGWTFLATDLIAAKGAGAVLPFPALIAGIAAAQLWLARRAVARGWIG